MNFKSVFISTSALCTLIVLASMVAQKSIPKPKAKPNIAQASTQNDTVTCKSGLRYVITQKNPKGIKAAKGDRVEAHYTGTLLNGKKFDSSRERNQTFSFTLGKGEVIAGWDEGFGILKKGEKATLIIPASLGYGSQDMGDIPPNSTLIFDVELVNVQKPIIYKPFSGKGKDTVRLKSGLKYIVIDKGNPKMKAQLSQTASVYYAGYLMDGTMFDGNFDRFEPINVPVTGAGMIKGWQEILPRMNKGMKVRVIIPPALAYGAQGYPGVIPENATIIFDMFLSDLK
jgi:peptidylprolyl isomerase